MKTLHLTIILIAGIITVGSINSVFAENNTLKLGPPASNVSIQEVNTGENSQWSSLVFGTIGSVIVVVILAYLIKTRKRKNIK